MALSLVPVALPADPCHGPDLVRAGGRGRGPPSRLDDRPSGLSSRWPAWPRSSPSRRRPVAAPTPWTASPRHRRRAAGWASSPSEVWSPPPQGPAPGFAPAGRGEGHLLRRHGRADQWSGVVVRARAKGGLHRLADIRHLRRRPAGHGAEPERVPVRTAGRTLPSPSSSRPWISWSPSSYTCQLWLGERLRHGGWHTPVELAALTFLLLGMVLLAPKGAHVGPAPPAEISAVDCIPLWTVSPLAPGVRPSEDNAKPPRWRLDDRRTGRRNSRGRARGRPR
jgi:hypothetical protein